jgi:2-keto-4-pentenoate hydratase/2-oxohepta-3-ene-1,7-dioic acid hydratase in catechol pathway
MAALNLITFADAAGSRAGVLLSGGRVLDLAVAMPPARDMLAVIDGGAAMLVAIRALAANPPANAVLPLSSVALQAPIPKPRRNVFCVGRNYMDHVAEGDRTRGITQSEVPKFPQFFTKAADCVIAPCAKVPTHEGVTKWLDYEVELVAIIGTAGRDIPKAKALEHVYGWTIGNDVTGRDLQRRHGQWFKGKSLDRSCPLGPVIVPASDLNAADLAISLKLNGEQRQASRTSKMIFDVTEIIHQLSSGFTLLPGDVIMTGTPEGVGYAMEPPQTMKAGDVMELTIEGIGTLTNTVSD